MPELRDPAASPGVKPHVLVAGVSTRAAAESAARAGFRVTAIDAFGDLDQHPLVAARTLERKFSARAAARAARDIECDAVAYLSSFENHPHAVATLARGRALWGNPPVCAPSRSRSAYSSRERCVNAASRFLQCTAPSNPEP